MKKAIVYYSMSGNTEYVANKIKNQISSDIIRLYPVNEYPNSGFKKYFWGGKSAVMKESPKLEKYAFDANKYDEIIIGSPIWAGNVTPPIRTFIKENKAKLKNKKISIFLCYSGLGAKKVLDSLKKELEINNFNKTIFLLDPKDKNSKEIESAIDNFIKMIGVYE